MFIHNEIAMFFSKNTACHISMMHLKLHIKPSVSLITVALLKHLWAELSILS